MFASPVQSIHFIKLAHKIGHIHLFETFLLIEYLSLRIIPKVLEVELTVFNTRLVPLTITT